VLLGWNPKTGNWTPPVSCENVNLTPEAFTAACSGDVYVATDDSHAAVQHWDAQSRTWRATAPVLPDYQWSGSYETTLRLATLTKDAVWVTHHNALWRFDNSSDLWRRTVIPSELEYETPMPTCQIGDDFYIATMQGLWRANTYGGPARAVPVPTQGLAVRQIAADSAGVWAICAVPPISQSGIPTAQTIAARLDARSGHWQFTTAGKGYPEWNDYWAPTQLWDANGEAWLNAGQGAYHWDLRSGRWRQVSERLGLAPRLGIRPGLGVLLRWAATDGRYDWLLTAGAREPNDQFAEHPPPIPALLRYDTQTGDYKGFDTGVTVFRVPVSLPTTLPDQTGQGLLAAPNALWIHAGKLLYRIDKETGGWKQVSGRDWPTLPAGAMTSAGGAVWLTDADSALVWRSR
jgi:hypothetical protein